jgi:hypothetical protein
LFFCYATSLNRSSFTFNPLARINKKRLKCLFPEEFLRHEPVLQADRVGFI